MTKTYIPEAIVGSIAIGVSAWMGPTIISLQQTSILLYAGKTDPASIALIVSSAMAVFILGTYLLIGTYCLGVTLEQVIFALHRHWKKGEIS